jgi:hypothetical protein
MRNQAFISYLRLATEITCIPSGPDRNCTAKEIPRKSLIISCRKICSRYMIQPEGRDMRYGDLFNISAIIVQTGSI